jgi:hypothetical protein
VKSTVTKRGVRGAKRADTNQLKDWLSNQQLVTSLGVVRKFSGESSHYEISVENGEREILVDVELIPSGTRVQCRLGFGNDGVYRIPRENAEVAVLIPYDPQSLIKDSLDFEPIIVGVLDTEAPSALTGDDIVVISAPKTTVISDNVTIESGDIILGAGVVNPLDELVIGSGVDTFTGSPYKALGSTTTKVKAVK